MTDRWNCSSVTTEVYQTRELAFTNAAKSVIGPWTFVVLKVELKEQRVTLNSYPKLRKAFPASKLSRGWGRDRVKDGKIACNDVSGN